MVYMKMVNGCQLTDLAFINRLRATRRWVICSYMTTANRGVEIQKRRLLKKLVAQSPRLKLTETLQTPDI